MKNLITRTALLAILILTVVTLAMPALAAAQIRVYVPFAFEAGSSVLPEGHYTVQAALGGRYLLLTNVNSGDGTNVFSMPAGDPANPKSPRLVFERLGSSYRLAEVWVGEGLGQSIPMTRQQLLVAKQGGTPHRVEIALKRH